MVDKHRRSPGIRELSLPAFLKLSYSERTGGILNKHQVDRRDDDISRACIGAAPFT
jgi:hypothetical protein